MKNRLFCGNEKVAMNRPTLGKLLRNLRARNGWTLSQMSARIGIPVSTLSKVEHERLTLTYDKLLQVSQRLGIQMSELFAGQQPEAEAAVTARRSIGRQTDAIRVETANYDYYYLCPELRRKRMVPVLTRIRAKSAAAFGDLVRHPGEEYIYVLEGKVEVHTEFYDPVVLNVGESIYIDSNMGHAYLVSEGYEEALVLGVCSSAAEGLMDSLINLHGPASSEVPAPAAGAASADLPKPKRRIGKRSLGAVEGAGA
jgi:transcriptional regulator with XRE-family HTH domain